MDLIPTRSKEKLPKGFSYPVGAEILSSALNSVPQYDEMELQFTWKDVYWASEYQKKLKSLGKIRVLEANYSIVFDEWVLRICSVPSVHNKVVKLLLQEGPLGRLRDALLAGADDRGSFFWKARYDLAEETMIVESNAS